MKNIKGIWIAVIGICLIIIGIIVTIVITEKEKMEEDKKLNKEINEKYTSFKEQAEEFTKVKAELDEGLLDNLYFEQVDLKYKEWTKDLDEYTKVVKKVDKYKDYIQSTCVDKELSNKDSKNKCDALVISYETAINYYVKDITKFNDFITEYNNETTTTSDDKDLYMLEFKQIDLNGDLSYSGIEK